jgi:hypothetical protein
MSTYTLNNKTIKWVENDEMIAVYNNILIEVKNNEYIKI